ncbi:MAG: FlgO family outer membrane protein [Thalassotalea sp.]
MKKTLPLYALTIIASALTSGCGVFPISAVKDSVKYCADDNGEFYPCDEIVINKQKSAPKAKSTLFSSTVNFQFLSEYTEQLAYDLKHSIKDKEIKHNIVVTTFVYLDETLRNTDVIGQQVATLLSADLQNNNLPVSELKLSGYIDINEQGEFALSQNIDELNPNITFRYICTGTLIENKQGLLINARIIDRTTNQIIGSASKTIPRMMLDNTRDTTL